MSAPERHAAATHLLGLLHPTATATEGQVRRAMAEAGYSEEQTNDALAGCQAAGTIRWVAFRGWCKGGRPA